MSWSLEINPTVAAEFADAVDAAAPHGQDAEFIVEDVAAAKAALKALGALVSRPVIRGNANGHHIEPGQDSGGQNWHEGIQVQVVGMHN